MKESLSVSVCMATYNGQDFISQQIQSILAELKQNDELIISDDSSTDDTIFIIKSINDPRIILLESQTHYNHIRNFQNALKYSKNDIMFLSDQDDLWVPGKVAAVMKELEYYDLINTDHSVIDENGKVLIPSYFAEVDSRPGIIKNLLKCSYFGCCMAFKKKVLEAAMPFPEGVSSHDVWLGHVADIYFKVKFLPVVYTQYRKHGQNLSSAANPVSPYTLWQKLGFRYQIVKATIPMLFRNLRSER